MPKAHEIEDIFYTYYGNNLVECLEDIKKECRDNGYFLLNKCTTESTTDFLELVLSNINIEKMINTTSSKSIKKKIK